MALLTVTSKDQELILVRKLMHLDVGVGGNDLVLGGELGALLELKIANSTGQGQVAVDAAEVDKATRGCDSILLVYMPGKGRSQYSGDCGSRWGDKLSSWGLWSWDSGLARPLMPSTPLESPALPCW